MADVNAIIAQGVRPIKVLNPLDMEAAAAKISSARQEQELNALRMAAYQRGVEEQNALRRSLQESYNPETGEYDLTRARTLGGQYGADPMALQQFASQQETAEVQRAQRQQETAARRTRALGLALATAKDDPSDERLNTAFSLLEAAGVNTTQLRQQFMSMPVEQRRSVIQNYAAGSEEGRAALAYVAPKPERQELGDRVDVIDMNPNSPTFRQVLQSFSKGAAPRQAQLLTPEEEEQKKRIAMAGRAPGTTVTVGLPAQEKAEQSRRGELLVKDYERISDAARNAARALSSLETQSKILDTGFRTGFGAETQKIAASVLSALGVASAKDYATNAQIFTAAANEAVLQKQLEQKGTQTKADADRISQTGAQLGNTPEANKFIVAVAKAQLKRDLDQRNFYDDWWKKNKTYDGAEDAWFSGPGNKSLFESTELKKYMGGPTAAPAAGRAQPAPAGGGGAAGDWSVVR